MSSRPRIPPQLKLGPFTLREALAAGVSRTSLRGKSWLRLGRGLYCWAGLAADPWRILTAWQHLLPQAVFAGASAAWILGLDVDPIHPVEIVVPPESWARSRAGLVVRHGRVTDPVYVRGLRSTDIRRTLVELDRRLPAVEALIMFDAALRLGLGRADCPLGMLAEPAESPMETRLRWLLIQAGFPRPEVQRDIRDADGRFICRADLYYASAKLVLEYDGTNHRDRLIEDNRRQNLLLNSGFRLLRFTASDVYQRQDAVVAQVRRGLTSPV